MAAGTAAAAAAAASTAAAATAAAAAATATAAARAGEAGRTFRRALISVYDKTDIVAFARALHGEFGVEILSTGGTAAALQAAGIPVTLVESITGFPEMLDGRVKTLHPRIHAAILADRDNPEHMRQLAEAGIAPIDIVVVNLYPFEQTIARADCTFEQAIEMIDIGGPCLLRAAAKNHRHVLVVEDPASYEPTLRALRGPADVDWAGLRRAAAFRAFHQTNLYDSEVAGWLSRGGAGARGLDGEAGGGGAESRPGRFPRDIHLQAVAELRYGENPHQRAEALRLWKRTRGFDLTCADVSGAETALSFNNYLDANAALELCAELTVWRRPMAGDVSNRPTASDVSRGPTSDVWRRPMAGDVSNRPMAGSTPASRSAARMRPIDSETFSARRLPHLQRPGATYFVTFRCASGILSEAERDITMSCCLHPHGTLIGLHAVVVMPDHVHLLFTPLETAPGQIASLSKIMHSIKGNAARLIAKSRARSGAVWQHESFDHIIRNQEDFAEKVAYIHENPDRAGLTGGGPYPWCAFQATLDWDKATKSAAVSTEPLIAGQRVAGVACPAREWHRMLGGATAVGANRPLAGSTPHRPLAGATPAAEPGAAPQPETSAGVTPAACFIKHTNACGVGVAADRVEAYRRAYLGDPNAAMGGILAVNFEVDAAFASVVMETYARFGQPLRAAGHPAAPGGFFVEVWVAPGFTDEAVRLIRGELEPTPEIPEPPRKQWGKRVRLLAVGDMAAEPDPAELDIKRIAGGVLMQSRDLVGLNEDEWKVVTKRAPTEAELADLRLAWLVCKHTKSNAITLVRDGMLIGNGAGQMSRVLSCRIATWMARENGHLGGTGSREQGTDRDRGAGSGGEQGTGNREQRGLWRRRMLFSRFGMGWTCWSMRELRRSFSPAGASATRR